MIRGQEAEIGYVPVGVYNVLIHAVEKKQSSSGNDMLVLDAEIAGPDIVEHAGRSYKTAGAKGTMYVMLNNKNGVDAALSQLNKPLEALGLLDQIPPGAEYGPAEVEALVKQLQHRKVSMVVSCQTEYFTDSEEKNAKYDLKLAKRDPETNEPLVRRYTPQFDFGQVRKLVQVDAEAF